MEEKLNKVISEFKSRGYRITSQRKNLLAIILNNPGCSCKELFYIAKQSDREIGRATVYRTVNSLIEFGLVNLKTVVIA